MRIIIFGASGLLGRYLQQVFAGEEVFAWDQETLDITDRKAVMEQCSQVNPDVIINAAAYNAVDEVETNPEASRHAFLVNAHAVHRLAEVTLKNDALFIHFSTDYVFDGKKGEPYAEDDDPRPLNAYGRSKREGEEMVLRFDLQGLKYYLIRTSRLFGLAGDAAGPTGSKETFPNLVLNLAAERSSLEFIEGSEIASPTYAHDLAVAIREMIGKNLQPGIYHRTNDGECSWYGFAKEVLDKSKDYTTNDSVKEKKFIELVPVAASEVPRPAKRPQYSVLKSTKLSPLRSWQESVVEYLVEKDKHSGSDEV